MDLVIFFNLFQVNTCISISSHCKNSLFSNKTSSFHNETTFNLNIKLDICWNLLKHK